MTLKQSLETCLRQKYFFDFRGRASRSEFWYFALSVLAVNLILSPLFMATGMIGASLNLILSLLLLPPNLGVTVRRFHDRGLSGWWLILPLLGLGLLALGGPMGLFANLLYFFMSLFYLVVLCMPGQPGSNKYGPPPA